MKLSSLKSLLRSRAAPPFAPAAAGPPPLPAPARHDGALEELSPHHAFGWVRDPARPEQPAGYEILLPATGEVLARGRADQFWFGRSAGRGHAFWTRFGRALTETERQSLVVRVGEAGETLPRSPSLGTAYEPLLHVAMDMVDNCNLRCPFCVFDYAGTHATHFMTPDTLERALRFLPYARDGEFWFSCLHEPTLHPDLMEYIGRVPRDLRRKLFYTTNLAKRMPPSYFEWLAANGMHHINVSIESRDPAVYEKMRKGARHRIFTENWDRLTGALRQAAEPTRIRYIVMAYRSNLREIPGLARYLLEERQAWQVEVRNTFDVPWIPAAFRDSEFLAQPDWDWLGAELGGLPREKVLLLPPAPPQAPPPPDASLPPGLLPGRVMFRLSWDGRLRVVAIKAASRDDVAQEQEVLDTNIRDLPDPKQFFAGLDETLAHPGRGPG